MSEIDNAWSETSGIAGEDSPPPADALGQFGAGYGNGYLPNGYVEGDEDRDEKEEDEFGGLRRQDTIKPGDSRQTNQMQMQREPATEFPRG